MCLLRRERKMVMNRRGISGETRRVMKEFVYTEEFDRLYAYDGKDLGVTCAPGCTCFKLWAPLAEEVELCLYHGDDSREKAFRCVKLEPEERGVWSLTLEEELHGIYYDFQICRQGVLTRTADPYAVGCGCNGYRSLVVDLKKTDPEGFSYDRAPQKTVENIIYELHIKDFSYDSHSGIPQKYRGKYKAFTVEPEAGAGREASSAGEEPVPTGMAYLKELGITHVHLLPFCDYGWLDEAGDDSQFNWGYDPVNYNVPEGSYATEVHDGTVRIRECKEMIQAFHQAGIRVVMDVVYNHTYEADSWLERSAPGYFCRKLPDGTLSDGSACGNDLAAGRAMVDNYIVNSVMYWAREYHIDGFRFDLMGLLTTELMNRIRQELDREFGPGEKLLYGEPWRAEESPMETGTHAALKENVEYLDENIAIFSDDTRDLIKGAVFYSKDPGFVNGGRLLEDQVLDAVTGWRDNVDGFRPRSCGQIINYVSAHDNLTLWDKLLFTLREEGELKDQAVFLEPHRDVLAVNKLAALMYFTCQGHIFFQAGEEFGRTKFGDENSFRSAPEVNMLRWEQTVPFRELVEYYKGLIALRKNLPGLYDKSAKAFERISGQTIHREGVVSFLVDNRDPASDCPWDTLFVAYNASGAACCIKLPKGDWEILADHVQADCRLPAGEEAVAVAHGGVLAGRRAADWRRK